MPTRSLEPRQRWRLTFSRDVAGPAVPGSGREYTIEWETALRMSDLPLATIDGDRPRLMLGAPLPTGASGLAELIDIWLTERLPAWRVREALGGSLPAGHAVSGLEDVWLGSPPLAGRVAAADYRVELDSRVDATDLARSAQDLIAAEHLPRERSKGGGVKSYDLRPLLVHLEVERDGGAAVLRCRTRIHPELGSGRPEEIVAALGDALGAPLEAARTVRERLLLAEDLGG
jgi:radical SAM-linked protein